MWKIEKMVAKVIAMVAIQIIEISCETMSVKNYQSWIHMVRTSPFRKRGLSFWNFPKKGGVKIFPIKREELVK